ncbi:MAG: permease [candidate division KSB1 bacterium]|nr:permease [candidate division KSB1 bacterium]
MNSTAIFINGLALICLVLSLIFNRQKIKQAITAATRSFLRILPQALPIIVLIGLFKVWVKKETVEKHLGQRSGLRGHFWGILLAGTTVGGLYVAFPVAAALYHKGARLAVIFSYISAAAIVRIPMTNFEASFLGIKFSLLRLAVSLPLLLLTSELLGTVLQKKNYAPQQN